MGTADHQDYGGAPGNGDGPLDTAALIFVTIVAGAGLGIAGYTFTLLVFSL